MLFYDMLLHHLLHHFVRCLIGLFSMIFWNYFRQIQIYGTNRQPPASQSNIMGPDIFSFEQKIAIDKAINLLL